MKTIWIKPKPLTRCQILGVCQSKHSPACLKGCRK